LVLDLLEEVLMSGMIDRLLGEPVRSNRVESMQAQAIVGGNANLAVELAERAELLAAAESRTLIEQDGDDDDLYVILAGSFSIVVNGRRVAGHGRGEHVGEIVMIEPTPRRSATVVAEEEAVFAKLSSAVFAELDSRYPEMYRNLAKTLARCLRERNKLVGR
jgi:CRP-like cAMP-binding protein